MKYLIYTVCPMKLGKSGLQKVRVSSTEAKLVLVLDTLAVSTLNCVFGSQSHSGC